MMEYDFYDFFLLCPLIKNVILRIPYKCWRFGRFLCEGAYASPEGALQPSQGQRPWSQVRPPCTPQRGITARFCGCCAPLGRRWYCSNHQGRCPWLGCVTPSGYRLNFLADTNRFFSSSSEIWSEGECRLRIVWELTRSATIWFIFKTEAAGSRYFEDLPWHLSLRRTRSRASISTSL